jgi:fructokinase
MADILIGVEMGGTGCKVAAFSLEQQLLNKETFKTEDPKTTLNQMTDWINANYSGRIAAVGIACFGPLCLDKASDKFGFITTTPKLAWQNTSVHSHFSQACNLPQEKVFIDTDVNVCALYGFDKAKPAVKESFCYITVGTGVGVGLIINSQCVHGAMHPEGGHVKVTRDQRDGGFHGVCPFHKDCIEGLVSNNAIKERLGLASVEELTSVSDDHEVWEIVGNYLGTMCANIFFTTSAEMIMLGGGVFNRKVLIEQTRKTFFERLGGYIDHPKVKTQEAVAQLLVRPELGDELGLYAAGFAASRL